MFIEVEKVLGTVLWHFFYLPNEPVIFPAYPNPPHPEDPPIVIRPPTHVQYAHTHTHTHEQARSAFSYHTFMLSLYNVLPHIFMSYFDCTEVMDMSGQTWCSHRTT